ncbi:MAG: zinc transporter ZupT [Bacteroidales bacterium]|nr:zinc transporter ZupT [Bacteroidales bacterium]MBN2699059.1 zinc transporter ZupT [Bacteroidales bacterium]
METGNFWFAFGLTLFAGLSTGIGSALAFFTRKTNTKFLSISLGFSAGVMVYVSFVEILQKAKESLSLEFGEKQGAWYMVLSFFAGILVIALIDKLIPSMENPHEIHRVEEVDTVHSKNSKLVRMGTFTAIAIAIHNFPEGIATFTAGLTNAEIAVPIAIAIAIHNIPEGIAVSIPVSYGTGSKLKGFFLSFLSGLAEPVGALLAYFILMPLFTESLFGFLFAGVAGIMVFISIDELLPTAREYGLHHHSVYGFLGGMAVMALSLLLFI